MHQTSKESAFQCLATSRKDWRSLEMNKARKQHIKARNMGMSNVDLLMVKESAKKAAKTIEKEATEKAFLYMLAIPLNVLFNDYWQKAAKKRAPKFIEDVMNLYDAVQHGVVSDKQLADLLDELAGVKIDADWMKGNDNEKA